MPRKKVDDTARVRCAKACGNCKSRKERCDGLSPCRRCLRRNVASSCQFEPPGPRTRQTRNRGQRALADHVDNVNQSTSDHEGGDERVPRPEYLNEVPQSRNRSPRMLAHVTTVPPSSRLIQDVKGKFMYIGDSANLSFLQSIRKQVHQSIGSCDFVDDPHRHHIVEAVPEGNPSWLKGDARLPPPALGINEATYLIQRYLLAMNCVMDLFDESELFDNLERWLAAPSAYNDSLSPIYYLVFALGAQTSPEDKDELAGAFFDHGRYLTASVFMENPSIPTVQCYSMIAMYMLGSSRRNAAFMTLGVAVRAAYALGLHSIEIARLFPPAELRTRERLWKVIRILDLFMSASLGRPPSTSETRDTRAHADYSASADLASIFEIILTDVYGKRMVSAEVLQRVSEHHRTWTAHFSEGLQVDCIQPMDVLIEEGIPNIGLLHVKEAYYWTIILLTRPFLLEMVSLHISSAKTASFTHTPKVDGPNQILVYACVESAIRTIDMLKVLLNYERIPKRLPFVVNSVFVSALVLGLAYFGDLHKNLPLKSNLELSRRLLARFPRDLIACRNCAIVVNLQLACDSYDEIYSKRNMDHHAKVVEGLFGQIHKAVDEHTVDALHTVEDHSRSDTTAFAYAHNDDGEIPNHTTENSVLLDTNRPPQSRTYNELSSTLHSASPDDEFEAHRTWTREADGTNMSSLFMAHQTLWFDPLDEAIPLFETIPNFNMDI